MNIQLKMEEDGEEILKNNTVDFVSFSYYGSRLTSADPEVNAAEVLEPVPIKDIQRAIKESLPGLMSTFQIVLIMKKADY